MTGLMGNLWKIYDKINEESMCCIGQVRQRGNIDEVKCDRLPRRGEINFCLH